MSLKYTVRRVCRSVPLNEYFDQIGMDNVLESDSMMNRVRGVVVVAFAVIIALRLCSRLRDVGNSDVDNESDLEEIEIERIIREEMDISEIVVS